MRIPFVLAVIVALGCGGGQSKPPDDPGGSGGDPTPVEQRRSELQIRQEAACEAAGPRLTACAVADTQQQSAETRAEADPERTAEINTREFIKGCVAATMSSR